MSSFRGPCCRSIIANKTKYSVEVVQSLSSLLRRSEGSDESDFLCYFHKRIDGAKFFAYSSIMQKKTVEAFLHIQALFLSKGEHSRLSKFSCNFVLKVKACN